MAILELQDVGFSYNRDTPVLKNIDYAFEKGKMYAIIGRSGAGKTTLLSLLSGLRKPTSGNIIFNDTNISKVDQYVFRNTYVGVVFQSFNLLTHLTAVENVELSMRATTKKIENKRKKALDLLQQVGLGEELANQRILKLSGGEQQRVAIARAIAYDPDIILADEPTGNLDIRTQEEIIGIFKRLAQEENKCIIVVTHSPEVSHMADEVYTLSKSKKK